MAMSTPTDPLAVVMPMQKPMAPVRRKKFRLTEVVGRIVDFEVPFLFGPRCIILLIKPLSARRMKVAPMNAARIVATASSLI
jgi:hypothetical protein